MSYTRKLMGIPTPEFGPSAGVESLSSDQQFRLTSQSSGIDSTQSTTRLQTKSSLLEGASSYPKKSESRSQFSASPWHSHGTTSSRYCSTQLDPSHINTHQMMKGDDQQADESFDKCDSKPNWDNDNEAISEFLNLPERALFVTNEDLTAQERLTLDYLYSIGFNAADFGLLSMDALEWQSLLLRYLSGGSLKSVTTLRHKLKKFVLWKETELQAAAETFQNYVEEGLIYVYGSTHWGHPVLIVRANILNEMSLSVSTLIAAHLFEVVKTELFQPKKVEQWILLFDLSQTTMSDLIIDFFAYTDLYFCACTAGVFFINATLQCVDVFKSNSQISSLIRSKCHHVDQRTITHIIHPKQLEMKYGGVVGNATKFDQLYFNEESSPNTLLLPIPTYGQTIMLNAIPFEEKATRHNSNEPRIHRFAKDPSTSLSTPPSPIVYLKKKLIDCSPSPPLTSTTMCSQETRSPSSPFNLQTSSQWSYNLDHQRLVQSSQVNVYPPSTNTTSLLYTQSFPFKVAAYPTQTPSAAISTTTNNHNNNVPTATILSPHLYPSQQQPSHLVQQAHEDNNNNTSPAAIQRQGLLHPDFNVDRKGDAHSDSETTTLGVETVGGAAEEDGSVYTNVSTNKLIHRHWYVPMEICIQEYEPSVDHFWRGNHRKGTFRRFLFGGETQYEPFEIESLQQGLSALKDAGISLKGSVFSESKCAALHRFLQGSGWNSMQFCEMVKNHLKWRSATFPIDLQRISSDVQQTHFCYVHGRDRRFRPVIVVHLANLKNSHLQENMLMLIYWLERCINELCIEGKVEQFTVIVNLKDAAVLKLPSFTLRHYIQQLTQNYPCRLHRVFLIDPSAAFRLYWKIVQQSLPEDTHSKCIFLSGPDAIKASLYKEISQSQVEKCFGGKAKYSSKLSYSDPILPHLRLNRVERAKRSDCHPPNNVRYH